MLGYACYLIAQNGDPRKDQIAFAKTPIGEYRPDWGIVFKGEKRLYFVAETKSTLDKTKRLESENQKIACGYKHFDEFEGVNFIEAPNLEYIQKRV